jgi:uncharacterized membrane protein YgcG
MTAYPAIRVWRVSLIFGCLAWAGPGQADERILSYHSDIIVAADATMMVEETIRVRAEGRDIRRGIYRDFPTRYTDRFENRYVVAFDVLEVTRDGRPELYHTEKLSNGVRVYIGSGDVFLDPGTYSYVIRYRTDRQLGFFADHDELYWNVTGNGWAFPIDTVSATVILPDSVPPDDILITGYTGYAGGTAQDYRAEVVNRRATIRSTGELGHGAGLTLVARWPKGHVDEPMLAERLRWLLTDNLALLLALIALVLSAIYLYRVWKKVGRDPAPGVIFPRYRPPKGLSPASARFISRMSYDDKALTAAVVNLAVKGYLKIEKPNDEYILTRQHSTLKLAPGEAVLKSRLFKNGEMLVLDDKNYKLIGAAKAAHKAALKRNYEKIYFLNNSPLLFPSFVVLVLMGFIFFAAELLTPGVVFLFVVNLILHVVFYYLLRAPTPLGRRILDILEGFTMYLNVAEKDELELRNPPEKTPELFEMYLPFALALGVEQAWSERFAGVFASLKAQGAGYHPVWYGGDFQPGRMDRFAAGVGNSFSSAISSASTPPGSASGGGGSSGGGGGGGGGGGW